MKSQHHRSRRHAGAGAETAGDLFPDGTALELARDPASGDLTLVRWERSSFTTAVRFDREGHTYVPVRLNRRLVQELLLPSRVIPHKRTGKLLTQIEALFSSSFNLLGAGAALLAHLVLATWIPESLPAAACIVLHGPFLEVTAIMRLLRSLCRHALLLGDLDHRSFRTLPVEKLRTTLLIAEPAQDPKTMRLMRISNTPGLLTTSGTTGQDLFSCKVLYSRDGGLTVDGAIHVTVLPGPPAGMRSAEDLQAVAEQFQPKLLGYRFAFAGRTVLASFDPAWSRSPVSGCCQALLATVAGDKGLLAQTTKLLADQLEEARAEIAMAPSSVLIECALVLSHESNKNRLRVKELAEALNAALTARGESIQVSAKQVGCYLRDAGLPPREFRGVYVLELLEPVRRRIHLAALSLEVPAVRKRTIRCGFCEEVWGDHAAADAPSTIH